MPRRAGSAAASAASAASAAAAACPPLRRVELRRRAAPLCAHADRNRLAATRCVASSSRTARCAGTGCASRAAWRALRAHAHHPAAVNELLGEAVAAAVLLAATLKFRGTLTFQLQGNGAVSLLVAQCTHDFRLRAVARCDEAAWQPRGAVGAARRALSPARRHRRTHHGHRRGGREAARATRASCPLAGDSPGASRWKPTSPPPSSCRRACCWRRMSARGAGVLVQKLPGASDEAEEAQRRLGGRRSRAWSASSR